MARIHSIAWSLILTTCGTVAFAGKDGDEAAPFDIRYTSVTPQSSSGEQQTAVNADGHDAAVRKLQDSLNSSHSLLDAIQELIEHRQLSEAVELLQAALTQARVSIVDIGNDHGGLPVLHLAVMKNRPEAIKVLLALDRETVRRLLFSQTYTWDGSDWKHVGETALALAVHTDRVEAAKLMLAAANEQGAARELIEVRIHRSTMGKGTVSNLFFWYVSQEMQKVFDLFPGNAKAQEEGVASMKGVLQATGLDKLTDWLERLPLNQNLK